MSDYLPSFIVDPVLRQARRFSERIGGDDSPTPASVVAPAPEVPSFARSFTLPAVPSVDFQRFNPTRFWSQSPPHSPTGDLIEDVGDQNPPETTLQSIARNIQLWANQINNLDVISPPLGPIDDAVASPVHTEELMRDMDEFPPLEPGETSIITAPAVQSLTTDVTGRSVLEEGETSLNPANELGYTNPVIDPQTVGRRRRSEPSVAPDVVQQAQNFRQDFGRVYLSRRRDGSGSLPEDDGMGPLRKRINAVWAGPGTAQEKSHLIHSLMMENYRQAQKIPPTGLGGPVTASLRATSPSNASTASQDIVFNVSEADLVPTYAPVDLEASDGHVDPDSAKPELGCIHYKRNIKMQCATCSKWYTCRLCHDEAESHTLPRRETRHMLCMLCSTPQKVSQTCRACGVQAAFYYCAVCKLWNNDTSKSIYHCDDCGICRLGQGLGKDFFHCKTCAACMSIQAQSTHKCIEKSTKCDCPICGEYLFTSSQPVAFMRCGHSIHELCFTKWCNESYKCPICSKSIANMESQFRRLDRHIEDQPMPMEYRDNRAYVFCNDCNSRSVTKYHWLGLKCAVCDSYNTAQLELLGAESPQIQERADLAQEMGAGEAGMTASQAPTPTSELTSPWSRPGTGHDTSVGGVDSGGGALARALAGGNDMPRRVRSPPPRRDSPFHNLPHSPTRSSRAMSPVVGSYFGTGQHTRPTNVGRRGSYLSVFSIRSENEDSTASAGDSQVQSQLHRQSLRLSQEVSLGSGGPTEDPNSTVSRIAMTTNPPQQGTTSGTSNSDNNIDLGGEDDDDEDMNFWGGHSPRSYEADTVAIDDDDYDEDDESSSDDDNEQMREEGDENDDDDDGDDPMDILIGHR